MRSGSLNLGMIKIFISKIARSFLSHMHLTPVGARCSIRYIEDYPNTILDFEDRFTTEAACREYLFQLCWLMLLLPSVQAWVSKWDLYECC